MIHVQKEQGLVQIHAGPGAQVYYTRDGTMPMGKSAMEVYAGPFTLLPGAWELVAVAKHRGRPDRFLLYFDALVLLEVSLNDRTSRREVLCVCRAWLLTCCMKRYWRMG